MNWELPKCSPYNENEIYRIVGIDPGTTCMGIAIIELNVKTYEKVLIWADTWTSRAVMKQYKNIEYIHGTRFATLYGYQKELIRLFTEWRVSRVACEGNYMHQYPVAYAALKESVMAIRLAATAYNPMMLVDEIQPSTVKNAVGVKGGSSNKHDIENAIRQTDMNFYLPRNLDAIDQHAWDAIAVAYSLLV